MSSPYRSTLSVMDVTEPVIVRLDDNPGILIEEVSPLKLFTDSWKVIQEYKLEQYFTQSKQLNFAWEILDKKCKLFEYCEQKENLKFLYTELQTVTKDAATVQSSLEEQVNEKKLRRKRDLLSIKNIFDVLNKEDAEKFKKWVETEKEYRVNSSITWKNQSQFFENEFGGLIEKTKELDNLTRLFNQEIQEMIDQSILRSGVELLRIVIDQFKFDTLLLQDAYYMAKLGKMHTKLLTPEKLNDSMSIAKQKFPEATFPSPSEIYKVSDLGVAYSNRSLYYYLSIPLISNDTYTLIKASPVPTRQRGANTSNTTVYSLQPESTHFALNSTAYVSISQSSLDRCKHLEGVKICKQDLPSRTIDDSAPCEIQFSLGKNISDILSCEIKTHKIRRTFWYRTSFDNQWIYSTMNKQTLIVDCKNSSTPRYNMTIDGVGKLFLPAGCSASTEDMKDLRAPKEIVTYMDPEVLKQYKLDIARVMKQLEQERIARFQKMVNETNLLVKGYDSQYETKEGRERWDSIKNGIRKWGVDYKLQGLDAAISSLTVVLILIVAMVVLWKLKFKSQCAGKPQPTASTIVNINAGPKADCSLGELNKSQDMLIRY